MALRSASVFLSAAAFARASSNIPRQQGTITWGECEFKHEWTQSKPLECAKLNVPLDYTDESNEATLDMDLLRIQATNEPVLGSLIFNPGGPGESGITGMLGGAPYLQSITQGQYHIISFDPRGTGRNRPFTCPNTTAESVEKRQDVESTDLPTSNLTALMEAKWPEYLQQAESCKTAHEADGKTYGTIAVARDMARILDGLGEDGMMRYYGVSYGTLLGWTFAATFPERVERMIIDGNMYWNGYDVESVTATDTEFRHFLDACVAHPEKCEVAAEGDVDTILSKLRTGLQTVADNQASELSEIKSGFLTKLYGPKTFEELGQWLAAFIKGGKEGLEAVATAGAEGGKGAKASDEATEWWTKGPDDKAKPGINCGDWPLRATDPSEVAWLIEQQTSLGGWIDSIAYQYYDCLVWPFEAAERYEGDFQVKTKNPVLVVNPTYDPVTPLVSAKNSSSTLEGSVLLEHKGFGHGTSAHISGCTVRALRAYLLEGTLPEEGSVCEPDHEIFSDDFDNLAVLKPFLDEAKVVDTASSEGEAASPTSGGGSPAEQTTAGSSASTSSISVAAVIGAMLLGVSFLAL